MVLIGAPPVFEMPARQALTGTSLLDVISRIPGTGDSARRWAFGLTWLPWGCGPLQTLDVNCDVTDLDPEDPDAWEEIREQPAFSLWDAIQCSTMGVSVDYLTNRLERHMDTLLSAAFASELVSGDASGGNSLTDDATALGDFDVPSDAVAVVIDGLDARLQGGQGIIHMTPGTLLKVSSHLEKVGNGFQTPSGHKVVADPGYIDATPATATVWGTGPVYYESDSFHYIGDPAGPESIDFSHNLRTVFSQRFGILVWDPCPVVKATTTVGTA